MLGVQMTRIDAINPRLLIDQHLLSGWREAPRVITLALHWVDKGKSPPCPQCWTLGKGHETFAAHHTAWVARHHAVLTAECVARGVRLKPRPPLESVPGFDRDWEPTWEAQVENLERLDLRARGMTREPTIRGVRVGRDYYGRMLAEMLAKECAA